jgi:Fibronectin type III domain
MKAQMSLEMVIGLLILLVVAAVVISLFLQNSNISNFTKNAKATLTYRNFKASCDSICQDAEASGNTAGLAKFCYTKLTGATDLNQNGQVDSIQADTSVLYACEDGLYCFHVTDCANSAGVKITYSDCRTILCNAYHDVYQNDPSCSDPWSCANQKVKSLFANGVGSCTLPQGELNWYQLYFGDNPCTTGPTGSSGTGGTTTATSSPTVVSVSCTKASSTSVNCNWTCPNAISTQSPGYLSISGTLQSVTITSQTGSFTFTNLTPGTKYNVGVVCDINNAALAQGTTIQI